MTPTLQMPYREKAAEEIGPTTFRKQILRTGSIPYKGKTLTFDRDYLSKAVDSFNAKAMDAVPFVLADDDNRHSSDPDRLRGEVTSLELAGDGIDAIVELTPEGADLIRKFPKLGVSARLVPDVERDGQTFPVVIEHVCGTLNPRVNGLRPWETTSVRSLSQDEGRAQVIDLSASEYMDSTTTLTDEHLEALKGLQGDERAAKVREILGEMKVEEPKVEKTEKTDDSKKTVADFMRGILGKKAEKLDDKTLEEGFASLQTPEEPKEQETTTTVVASLSDDDKRRIDLAESRSLDADRRVAEAEWKAERKEYLLAGVPPAILDLAEPLIKSGKQVIELSDSEAIDASEIARKLLDAHKGYVDLSQASGSDVELADDEAAKEAAKRWKENPA